MCLVKTSSPGCCNYPLQRTALDDVSRYRKEAIKKLLRNFYVVDVLKSLPSVRDANLGVKDLCKRGLIEADKIHKHQARFIVSNS